MPKLLIGVLSSDRPGFLEIRKMGQIPTWISTARSMGFSVVPYTSDIHFINDIHTQILSGFRAEEFVNHTPLRHLRRVKTRPAKLSRELKMYHDDLPMAMLNQEGDLVSNHPDSLASVGIRTIEFFKFALENYDFDYMVRTNTSSYLNAVGLLTALSPVPKPGRVYSSIGHWGAVPYPSGALYVLSRFDVEEVVENESEWIHEYIDDVALGIVLKRIRGAIEYVPIPRFDFSETNDFDFSFEEGFIHYRCKSRSPQITVERMLRLGERGI